VNVVVREARIGDAAGIAQVHVAAWRAAYAGLLPAAYLAGLSVDARAQRWAAALNEPHPHVLATVVAVRNEDIAGFAIVGRSRDDDVEEGVGELWAIYADPRHWGTGVGHALHDQAMHVLRAAGLTCATLWVLQGNDRATAFYRRHGWVADGGTKTDWRDDVRLDEERYRVRITPTA